MGSYLFTGGRFLDPRDGIEVLVEGNVVKEVSDRPIPSLAAQQQRAFWNNPAVGRMLRLQPARSRRTHTRRNSS
jgi:hypothetical protein